MTSVEKDIIVALATSMGEGAISVIRVSGTGSIKIIDKVFRGKSKLTKASSHTIHYGRIISLNKEVIDDVLVSVFLGPNSYSGEDSIEISTHASPIIIKKIIELFVSLGIRTAEPGEFTKRAFLNGKIDLAQAEAVADLINSRTEASLRGARNQLDGVLSQKIETLREGLISVSSLIELELDFAEEDLEFLDRTQMAEKLDSIIKEINLLLSTYSFGRVIRDGVNVAIVGKPNVGKSSLLNYILKESRVIVSEIPGTTRDVIREEASIDGILFRLFDTAGIRLTDNLIEREGVERSLSVVENADIVVFVNDVLSGYSEDVYEKLLDLIEEDKIISVLNKIDLNKNSNVKGNIQISAKYGEGIEELFNMLKLKSIGSKNYTEKGAIVSNIRHYNALKKAKKSLKKAKKSMIKEMSGEFISIDLRLAEDLLGEVIGRVTSDDILNNIFSKFCIGK